MNLTDFRTQLTRQADTVDGVGNVPLVAIRRRATTIRRRRASIAGVGVAMLATAVTVTGNALSPDTEVQPARSPTPYSAPSPDDRLPSREPPAHPKDYVRDDFRFGYRFGSQALQQAVIGALGQTTISIRVMPKAGELPVNLFCATKRTEPGTSVELLVDGMRFTQGFENLCAADGGPGTAGPVIGIPADRDGWSGRSVQVRLRMIDSAGNTRTDPTAQLGVAVYDQGPQRRIGPVGMPEVIAYKGYEYKLGSVRRAAAARSQKLEVATPAGVHMLVAGGVTSGAHFSVQDIYHRSAASTTGPGFGWLPVAARPKDRAWVQWHGGPRSGELFIGIYTLMK